MPPIHFRDKVGRAGHGSTALKERVGALGSPLPLPLLVVLGALRLSKPILRLSKPAFRRTRVALRL
jgi:hypothetical protein